MSPQPQQLPSPEVSLFNNDALLRAPPPLQLEDDLQSVDDSLLYPQSSAEREREAALVAHHQQSDEVATRGGYSLFGNSTKPAKQYTKVGPSYGEFRFSSEMLNEDGNDNESERKERYSDSASPVGTESSGSLNSLNTNLYNPVPLSEEAAFGKEGTKVPEEIIHLLGDRDGKDDSSAGAEGGYGEGDRTKKEDKLVYERGDLMALRSGIPRATAAEQRASGFFNFFIVSKD